MNKIVSESPFEHLLRQAAAEGRTVILDGGTGTELDNRGMDTSGPLWSGDAATHYSDLLETIHRDYVQSGADIITSATFRSTDRAFAAANQPQEKWKTSTRLAVSIAKRAADTRALVAGSVAPLHDCFLPQLAPGGIAATEEHSLLCTELIAAGVDLLLLETFGTLREISAVIEAAKEATSSNSVPFALSVTTNTAGDLISGEPVFEALDVAHSGGASAFLLNCIPVSHVKSALDKLVEKSRFILPIGVYPNLGIADPNQDWKGSAYLTPEAFAKAAQRWKAAGTRIIGGCCGSTPDHIRALKKSR